MILFSDLASITSGKLFGSAHEVAISELITDSRKAIVRPGAVFFSIRGTHHDGHNYVQPLYDQGIRLFVIERNIDTKPYRDAAFIVVKSSIQALQALATEHRNQFSIPIIAVTGSNGKTIVKEWLNQLLSKEYNIAKSPASYNSQIGVPLSLWQMQSYHQLGIFESGISSPGEMERLQKMIRPSIGIFTNIGTAHDENFESRAEKINEKLKLFTHCDVVIYCRDQDSVNEAILNKNFKTVSWGFSRLADVVISRNESKYEVAYKNHRFALNFPFVDSASVENAFHCITAMLHLGYEPATIRERVSQLKAIPMRLELKEGINNSQIIDDSYNNDLAGLRVSLDFLAHQVQKPKRSLILSDILQSGLRDYELVKEIADLISKHNLNFFIGIGKVLSTQRNAFGPSASFYNSTGDFLSNHDTSTLTDQVILVKGARSFHFEEIVSALQRKVHGTVMEVDLGALVYNLNFFRAMLSPRTKLMVMVKAFGYGSGNIEVASVLQYHKIDYLGVAYADEGVELRNSHIRLPIMVMNPTADSFQVMLNHNLEPEIYSFKILNELITFLNGRPTKVHLKIDTGMHRLGFGPSELQQLADILNANSNLKVESIFSHLAGSDEAIHDDYSLTQVEIFQDCTKKLESLLGYRSILHILNTPGILRFPNFQLDMVRLGIGLYGVDPTSEKNSLRPVATLKTVVSQVRELAENETIGYGRKGEISRPTKVATIAIGYADGFSRAFSRGVGIVSINGKRAPIIGNVCMDMSMVDVTGMDVKEGDEVVIFGKELPLAEVAERIHTIPYEILTNTSERVKRVFVAESL